MLIPTKFLLTHKDAVTPAEVHKVDSAIVNMGQQIAEDFKKIMKR